MLLVITVFRVHLGRNTIKIRTGKDTENVRPRPSGSPPLMHFQVFPRNVLKVLNQKNIKMRGWRSETMLRLIQRNWGIRGEKVFSLCSNLETESPQEKRQRVGACPLSPVPSQKWGVDFDSQGKQKDREMQRRLGRGFEELSGRWAVMLELVKWAVIRERRAVPAWVLQHRVLEKM